MYPCTTITLMALKYQSAVFKLFFEKKNEQKKTLHLCELKGLLDH